MRALLLLTALGAASPVAAQTQTQMNSQAATDWKAADAVMTAQWKRTYAHMKGLDANDTSRGGGFGYAAALLESQRAWLRFRDRECIIEGGRYAGGSMAPMVRADCLARLTRERTTQLKELQWKR